MHFLHFLFFFYAIFSTQNLFAQDGIKYRNLCPNDQYKDQSYDGDQNIRDGEEDILPLAVRLQQVENFCLQKASQFRCQIMETSQEQYRVINDPQALLIAQKTSYYVLNSLVGFMPLIWKNIKKSLYRPDAQEWKKSLWPQKVRSYHAFLLKLQKLVEAQQLNRCQRSCLTLCSTSYLMAYRDHMTFTDGSRYDAFNGGQGGCKQFAHLAYRIGQGLGVPIRKAHSSSHAFVEIEYNGRWYMAEPQEFIQNQTCHFYQFKN